MHHDKNIFSQKSKKVLALSCVMRYTFRVTNNNTNTMTPTTAPEFTTAAITKEINTEAKTTQGKAFFNYYAAKDFTVYMHYNDVRTYKAGEQVGVERCGDAFTVRDGYGTIVDEVEADGVKTKTHLIPADWIVRRQFCIVREYKTTIWEVI
jgi:hypothetical protein